MKKTAIKYLGLGSIAIGTTAKNTATPMMNSGIKIGTWEMKILYVIRKYCCLCLFLPYTVCRLLVLCSWAWEGPPWRHHRKSKWGNWRNQWGSRCHRQGWKSQSKYPAGLLQVLGSVCARECRTEQISCAPPELPRSKVCRHKPMASSFHFSPIYF